MKWNNKKEMTLGEFRKFTKDLNDDIKLTYGYAEGNFPICTMNPINDDTIKFVNSNYGEDHIMGCIRVATFLKKKE